MTPLDQLFDQFLRERTYLKNVTPKTRIWYESAWKAFKATQATATVDRPSSAPLITRADLNHFVVSLRERGVKPVSCNTWVRALNAFCRWLHEQGEMPTLIKLSPQRLEKRLLRTHDVAVLLAIKPKPLSVMRLIVPLLDAMRESSEGDSRYAKRTLYSLDALAQGG